MSQKSLLRASHLAAMRGERLLFKGLSFDVQPGAFVRLKGSNGSGKTTLLRQLAGLSECQSGEIDIPAPFHWVGHAHGLKAYETPRQHLKHWARVWGAEADIPASLKIFSLDRPADVPSRYLSAGQRRRTALARLTLEERSLWLLDEPFNALDADGVDVLSERIKGHCASGGAVIAALHGSVPIPATQEIEL